AVGRPWIVNSDRVAGTGHHLRKVAVPHFGRRQRILQRGAGDLPRPFERREPERLVLPVVDLRDVDRAAGADAELVAVQEGRLGEAVLPLARYTITAVSV